MADSGWSESLLRHPRAFARTRKYVELFATLSLKFAGMKRYLPGSVRFEPVKGPEAGGRLEMNANALPPLWPISLIANALHSRLHHAQLLFLNFIEAP